MMLFMDIIDLLIKNKVEFSVNYGVFDEKQEPAILISKIDAYLASNISDMCITKWIIDEGTGAICTPAFEIYVGEFE